MGRKTEKLKEQLQFSRRFLQHPATVSSILPSSTWLAKKIIRKIPSLKANDSPFSRYLEIGAGTGIFTEQIIQKLKPTDILDIVEYDPMFCQILNKKFRHLSNVTIHESSILDYEAESYDAVISALPFNTFQTDFTNQVLMKYASLTKNGRYVSFYEYIGFASIKQTFLLGKKRLDFKRSLKLRQKFSNRYCEEIDHVWLNVFPARVRHCKIY